jgi:hypothetical protein
MKYVEATLGVADDETDPDGVKVLCYRDALNAAREWWQREERRAAGVLDQRTGPYTVSDALHEAVSADGATTPSPGRALLVERLVRSLTFPQLGSMVRHPATVTISRAASGANMMTDCSRRPVGDAAGS